jgi:protein-S-isoprenylcysteine O-methyltransferase Ste14
MIKLIIQTIGTFILGVIMLGSFLFIPAGTLNYWQAWLFILVFLLSSNAVGVYLSLKNPELLERRKKAGPTAERNPIQKIIISLVLAGWIAVLVFSGFDHRFGWSSVPLFVVIIGDALILLGFLITFITLLENRYAGSSIEVVEGQKVASSGLYSIIRHPMYFGAIILMTGVPLALGSYLGLAIIILVVPALVLRILDEEKLLEKDLPGYREYEQEVRYRLIPYIW